MAKISSMMDIGKRSMMNSQTALQTVSHNIANKATEGFSRQRVELQTAPPVVEGRLQVGMGNRAAQVTRTNNPYLEKQLQKETGSFGYHQGRTEPMARVEQVFNEQSSKGLNQYMSDFFNAFRELSNNPESVTTRQMVKESSDALVMDFKRVNSQLEGVQNDVDETIKSQISEVNKMIQEVGTLNEQVANTELQGIPANDQRDRRDLLLKKLNEKIDIHWAEGTGGMVHVSTAGNAILVSGFDHYKLDVMQDNETGHAEIFYKQNDSTKPFRISDRIKGGQIGGAIEVRDHVIEDMKSNIDLLAFTMAREVNNAHMQGFDRSGREAVAFFAMPDSVDGASKNIELNNLVASDVNRIAAGVKKGAPGDNTVANVISQLQQRGVLEDGNATLDDFYSSNVGSIGVLAQRAVKSKESQENILKQLNNLRDSISGVSLDEETTRMMEYQKAFEASARVIKTADEMFDTILNLKRL